MKADVLNEQVMNKWESPKHPYVDAELVNEWQCIIDLIAKILNVPAALIMRLSGDSLDVFIRSDSTGNPFIVGEKRILAGSGLYCEKVLNTQKKVFVLDASTSSLWQNNPELKLGMINYLGLPLSWPNKEPFGTICVMNNEAQEYSEEHQELLNRFKKVIEVHLIQVDNYQQLKMLTRELERLAYVDSLTNILNRRAFFEQGNKELHRTKRYNHACSLLMIDIDNFKLINDKYGHGVGDEVLKAFALMVSTLKRNEDVFARVGGEEFAILLPETPLRSAQQLAQRIVEKIGALKVPTKNDNVSFTVSIGVTECRPGGSKILQMMSEADLALYDAKERGRNRVCLFR